VTVNGTNGSDNIQVSGAGGSVTVAGLPATVTLTGSEGANDQLVVEGGAGNDVITAAGLAAGVINLTIDGGAGNDTITGSAGNDLLKGGDGNDTVIGGRGNDVALLGNGNDTFIWNPGDGSDIVEGQAGTDTLVFNGAGVNENIDISANGSRVRMSRDVGNVIMDLGGIEHIQLATLDGADNVTVNDLSGTGLTQVAIDLSATPGTGQSDGVADTVTVNGTAGDDRISVASSGASVVVNGLATQVTVSGVDSLDSLVVNGGAGNDTIDATRLHAGQVNLTINGGDGNDTILGSAGNDTVNGGRGNDVANLGAGNDTFVWNPGDGSDIVDGGAGNDTLLFNGANVNEKIDISANGGRVTLARDVGAVTMDLDNIETLDVNALGGADTITVNDMSRTDVRHVAIDLSATLGSGAGDGQADTVVINATNGADNITITEDNGVVTVSGLGADVTITGFEAANDRLVINGLGGDDVITAAGLPANILLTENGGDGNDILLGGVGNDTLNGGAGDDILIGGGGQDILDGGAGNNVLLQAPVTRPGAATGGSPAASAALLSQFMASSFVTAGDGHGATPLVDPQASQPPQLALPHAA
jgi:Ca2+-binding RTX toxin-like protein